MPGLSELLAKAAFKLIANSHWDLQYKLFLGSCYMFEAGTCPQLGSFRSHVCPSEMNCVAANRWFSSESKELRLWWYLLTTHHGTYYPILSISGLSMAVPTNQALSINMTDRLNDLKPGGKANQRVLKATWLISSWRSILYWLATGSCYWLVTVDVSSIGN